MRNRFIVVLLTVTIFAINVLTASQTRELKMQHGKTSVPSVRKLPNANRFISASSDGTVVKWDLRSGKRDWQTDLDGKPKAGDRHTISNILGMDVSPNGSLVAISYSQSHVVRDTIIGKDEYHIALLDSGTGAVTRILTGHTALIGQVAFSPNGELLLSESGDSTARLWNTNNGQEVLQIKLKERGASVAFSPDGKLIAIATQPLYGLPPQPIVGLYDARTGTLVREFPRSKNAVTSVAFSPDNQLLAIASGDAIGAQIDLWNLTSQDSRVTVPMPKREIHSLAFTDGGRLLAVGGYGGGQGLVELRDMRANSLVQTFRFDSDVTALDFSSDATELIVGTRKGQITALTLPTHRS